MTRSIDTSPPFAQLAKEPALAATWRALLSIAVPSPSLGFPRELAGQRPDLARARCGLSLVHQVGGERLLVLLRQAEVQALSERMLGGEGRLSERALASPAVPAELGCVAYLVARLAACVGAAWQLADASLDATAMLEEFTNASVCLPVQLDTELGVFALALIAEASSWPGELLHARLSVDDHGPPPGDLAVGDLVLLDAGPTLLSTGLSGDVVVRVSELASELVCQLEADRLAGSGTRALRRPPAELVLAERAYTMPELARLSTGALAWPLDGSSGGLRIGGEMRAAGEIVRLRGALGLRITTLTPA